jgi:hypothetical protein
MALVGFRRQGWVSSSVWPHCLKVIGRSGANQVTTLIKGVFTDLSERLGPWSRSRERSKFLGFMSSGP